MRAFCCRWTKPVFGERMRVFDDRKLCIICRAPIVFVRRYGRIINKSAIDMMERVFYQHFETKFGHLKLRLDKTANELDTLQGSKNDKGDRNLVRNILSIRHQINAIAPEFLQLLDNSNKYVLLYCLTCPSPSNDCCRDMQYAFLAYLSEDPLRHFGQERGRRVVARRDSRKT